MSYSAFIFVAMGAIVLLPVLTTARLSRIERVPPHLREKYSREQKTASNSTCTGGLCMGPRGSYPWKPLSYPWTTYTSVMGTMVVPGYPKTTDDITYYIWTDLQFGDAGLGYMNQFVPQLVLGEALDGSSDFPNYEPRWGHHKTWMFGAHYFFQVYTNESRTEYEAHAAYGELYPASPGEMLYTQFNAAGPLEAPVWTLTMGVVGDSTRVSTIVVPQPYMGLGAKWKTPSISWAEANYTNMSSHSCWELYGANDLARFPSTGTSYSHDFSRGYSSHDAVSVGEQMAFWWP